MCDCRQERVNRAPSIKWPDTNHVARGIPRRRGPVQDFVPAARLRTGVPFLEGATWDGGRRQFFVFSESSD